MPPKVKLPKDVAPPKEKAPKVFGRRDKGKEPAEPIARPPSPQANRPLKRLKKVRSSDVPQQEAQEVQMEPAPQDSDPLFAPKEIDFEKPYDVPEWAGDCITRFLDAELKALPTPFPDEEAFNNYGNLHQEVKNLLCASGLSILYEADPGVSRRLTYEFIGTFVPTYVDDDGIVIEDLDLKNKKEREGYTVGCWDFNAGERHFAVSRSDLAAWLRFPINGEHKEFSTEKRDEFWRMLCGSHEYFVTHQAANRISNHTWRVIHKIIAESFVVRKDGARFVTGKDIDLMILISQGKEVDWIHVLTELFLEHQSSKSAIKGLGGGTFISHLCLKFGFNVGDDKELERKRLDLAGLREAKIINKHYEWKVEKYPSAEVARYLEKRANEDRVNPPSRPWPWIVPEASSKGRDDIPPYASRILSRLEADDRKRAAFSSYVTDANSCYEHNFARIFEKLNLGEPRRATPFTWPVGYNDAGPSSRTQGNDGGSDDEDE